MNSSLYCLKRISFIVLLFISYSVVAGDRGTPFIHNTGQWVEPFSYKLELTNLTVFTEASGFTFVARESIEHIHDHKFKNNYERYHNHHHKTPETRLAHAFRLTFVNANQISFSGEKRLSSYHNYFLGNDRSRWRGHVPLFEELISSDLYEGIHLSAVVEKGSLKYDYIVSPGADPNQIRFSYSGLDDFQLSEGKLQLLTSVGTFVESIPRSYQIIDGEEFDIPCEYFLNEDGSVSFNFPDGVDPAYPLVVDPTLVAATLSGTGSGSSNYGHGAAFDLAGNIYTHARSFGSAYPTNEGSFQEAYGGGSTDAAVSKLTPDGSDLIFASFIGGNGGELPISSVVNGNGDLYLYGNTTSPDFPTSAGAIQESYGGGGFDIFVTAFSNDGSELVGSTYLGGSDTDGSNNLGGVGYDGLRGEINLNFNGEVYLVSGSSSADFPTTAGVAQETKDSGQDGVVVKMSPDLSEIVWSTFLGGTVDDMAYGVRIKDDQTVYIAGAVGGSINGGNGGGFVTTANAYQTDFAGGANDAFVTQLAEDGSSILNSTFLGESSGDRAYFLDFDNQNDVWVYMYSQSSWDVTDGAWGTGTGNVLVHKLSEDLSELLVTSYLSTSGNASGTPVAFMVDLCNDIYISAYGTQGGTFVASEDALFSTGGFYVGVYEEEMSDLVYGTYYTGTHVDGGTSRFDKQGIVYQGVCSGGGFNTTDDAWATGQNTGWDIGVFKIDFEIETVNAVASAAGQLTGCAPHTIDFENFSTGESFLWNFGNGDETDEFAPSYTYTEPGEYLVSLIVEDLESCNLRDTAFIPIQVFEEVEFVADFDFTVDCETGTIEITDASQGPGDMEYQWDMGDGTILTDVNPSHTYELPGEYTVVLTLESDACNEIVVLEQIVEYVPFVQADFSVDVVDFCDDFIIQINDGSDNAEEYTWDLGDGTILTDPGSFQYTYESSGTYEIQLIVSSDEACIGTDTSTVEIEVPEPPVLDPVLTIEQTGLCQDLTALGILDPNGPAGTYSWTIDGVEEGNEPALEFTVSTPGVYEIQVTVVDAVCGVVYQVGQEFEFFQTLGYDLPPSVFLCYYEDNLILDATVPYPDAIYNWNNGLSSEPTLTVTKEGDYEVEVFFNGCVDVQSTDVNIGGEFPLAFDALICEDQSNIIEFEQTSFIDTVIWDNGQTGFSVEVFESGYYPFTAIDVVGCEQIDSLLTIPRDDDPNIEVPNVFSPNGDGRNDVWQIQGDPLVYYDMLVYNRWGRSVFQTNEVYGSWNGDNLEGSGEALNEDTFMYILTYRDQCDLENQVKTGDLKILR